MSDKIVCTVKRATWARGGKGGESRLLNNQGNFCCLGFLGKICGIPEPKLLGASMPYSTFLSFEEKEKYPAVPYQYVWDNFASINDDKSLTDEVREQQLKQLAEDNGFTFVFED